MITFAYIVFLLLVLTVIIWLAKNVRFGSLSEMERFWGCGFDEESPKQIQDEQISRPRLPQ